LTQNLFCVILNPREEDEVKKVSLKRRFWREYGQFAVGPEANKNFPRPVALIIRSMLQFLEEIFSGIVDPPRGRAGDIRAFEHYKASWPYILWENRLAIRRELRRDAVRFNLALDAILSNIRAEFGSRDEDEHVA
jgi:hypothetical protein